MDIVNAYVLAFFNQTLKGTDEPLLQQASADYPEVSIDIIEPPGDA
jgi:hypothetical protein